MTDAKFKWLTGTIAFTVVALTAIYMFAPQRENTDTMKPDVEVGEYVYISLDKYERPILHVDRKCRRLNFKGVVSNRYETSRLNEISIEFNCPECVSDKAYEDIQHILSAH